MSDKNKKEASLIEYRLKQIEKNTEQFPALFQSFRTEIQALLHEHKNKISTDIKEVESKMQEHIKSYHENRDADRKESDEKYLTKERFAPYQKVAWVIGLLFVTTIVGAILSSVITTG